jgi:hypothetical protein
MVSCKQRHQYTHIYNFHTLNLTFEEIFLLNFLSIQPLVITKVCPQVWTPSYVNHVTTDCAHLALRTF